MKNKILALLVLSFTLIFIPPSKAQNIQYARQVVDTLCSPNMHGRGYVNKGDSIAAEFIASEYKRLGLKHFGEHYFQYFPINANIFPDKMSVSINDKPLIAGQDFIIQPESKGGKGSYKVKHIKAKHLTKTKKWKRLLKKDFSQKGIVISYKNKDKALISKIKSLPDSIKALSYIYITDAPKLTWHISSKAQDYTAIEVLEKSVPSRIRHISLDITQQEVSNYKTQNVVAYIEGSKYPEQFFAFSAHYDHLGRMGAEQYIPGANDNASGVAMLLNLADYYKKNPPEYSIVFMAFGGEELGLLGSRYFVDHPLVPLSKIKFLLNVDILGTGDEGITAVNAVEFPEAFKLLLDINEEKKYLPKIKKRGKSANSDHWFFFEQDVPCFFIYTMGGIQAYHDIYDKPETLPLTEFEDLTRLFTDFVIQYDNLDIPKTSPSE